MLQWLELHGFWPVSIIWQYERGKKMFRKLIYFHLQGIWREGTQAHRPRQTGPAIVSNRTQMQDSFWPHKSSSPWCLLMVRVTAISIENCSITRGRYGGKTRLGEAWQLHEYLVGVHPQDFFICISITSVWINSCLTNKHNFFFFIFIPCKKIRYKVKQPTTCTRVFCF